MNFGSNEEDVLICTTFDESIGGTQTIEKARALISNIKRRYPDWQIQLSLNQNTIPRKAQIRTQGGVNNKVDVFLLKICRRYLLSPLLAQGQTPPSVLYRNQQSDAA